MLIWLISFIINPQHPTTDIIIPTKASLAASNGIGPKHNNSTIVEPNPEHKKNKQTLHNIQTSITDHI